MRTVNSRLERLEAKRSAKKAALLSVLTVSLIALAVIFGIPTLVRIAVVVGDLSAANKPIDKNDMIAPVPPTLYSPYTATNSALLTLSGLSEPGSTVYVTNNGEPAGNIITKEDGTFQISSISLNSGNNELRAVAADQSNNNSNPSRPVSVYYSTKQPKLEVEAPTEGQSFSGNDPNIEVRGITEAGNKLLVNDRMAVVGNDGKWTFRIGLGNGENTVTVIASDKSGNQTKKEIKVTYVQQ